MKRIQSFSVNHDLLDVGMYLSRVDGDVKTYDVRMVKPNCGTYPSTGSMHTIEHLFATYARNSKWSDQVLYVGPMGCRTGFYLLVRDTMSPEEAIELVRDSLTFIVSFEGELPGSKRIECGNYLDHDLDAAKRDVKPLLDVLQDYPADRLTYRTV